MLTRKILLVLAVRARKVNRALALMKPTTSETAYLGGIESSICT